MTETDKDKQDDLRRERIGGVRMISLLVICFAIVALVVLWLIVYNIRIYQINREVDNLLYAVDTNEETTEAEITNVRVKINTDTYALYEFVQLDEIPATVDVIVYYADGEMLEKQAYISYDDVEDVEYVDNTYGRLILPDSLNK